MSAMRKVRFAVLESSLLARKGAARPAVPADTEPDQTIVRSDAEPHVELGSDRYDGNLAALITRLRPAMESVVEHPEAEAETCPVAFEAAPEAAAPVEPEPALPSDADDGRSMVSVVKEWTERVVRDRRIAVNLHPRGLNRDQAARYVGLSLTTFLRLIAEGVLPEALRFGRRCVWDLRALDEALDRMSGLNAAGQPVVRDA